MKKQLELNDAHSSLQPMKAMSISDSLLNITSDMPISASNTSVKLIGYVQQGDKVTGEPGITIKISHSAGTTFTVEVSASATAEAGMLFAKASVSAGVTVTNSWVTNRIEEGSWQIPNNGR